MDEFIGFFVPAIVSLVVGLLHILLPGRWYEGYATRANSTEKLHYRLNGFLVGVVTMLMWGGLVYGEILSWDYLYIIRWESLVGAIILGLFFSFTVYYQYPRVKDSTLADFFLGRAMNIQLWDGRVDIKMWLYLVGAILLELNVLSFAAHHYILFGSEASTGIFLCAGLITYFIFDYLTFEHIHLYTYDLFAERVGFKLGWGCLAFYPFFYAIPLWSTVDVAGQTPLWVMILAILIFVCGWVLARGANTQKFIFKNDISKPFLGIKPKYLSSEKGNVLISGFWGLSRHINYLGEILMAVGIVLSTGHADTIWPWLYPIYYILLLIPRQLDDDRRCAAKYGPLWDEYIAKVPYRIIPYIY